MLNELYHIATPWAKATKSQINMNRMLGVAANYRMAGSDHADPELQAKIVRMAREHWRAALRVPNSKKREKSKLWMLICCPAAGRWMWRLGKKLKQG